MTGPRVLVFGPRDHPDMRAVWDRLDALHRETPISCLIQGGARGADRHGRAWASARGVPIEEYEANWTDLSAPFARIREDRNGRKYNAVAGKDRNERMLREGCPTHAYCFQFRGTRFGHGTADMLERCRTARHTRSVMGGELILEVFTI